jgi:hypothetical protein
MNAGRRRRPTPPYTEGVSLADLGWDDDMAARFAPWAEKPDIQAGRVLIEFNHNYRVAIGVRSGRLQAAQDDDGPAAFDSAQARKAGHN